MKMINLPSANEIIIISEEEDGDEKRDVDARTVKTLFAVIKTFNEAQNLIRDSVNILDGQDYMARIALQVLNANTARILSYLDKKNPHLFIHVISQFNFIARIMAQSSLQTGLEKVYHELLSFSGNEIYVKKLKNFGISKKINFEDIIYSFPHAVPIGFVKNKETILNPAWNEKNEISPEDSLIYIAENSHLHYSKGREYSSKIKLSSIKNNVKPMKILVIGEGRKVEIIIKNLAGYVPDETTIIHTNEQMEFTPARNIKLEYRKDLNSIISHCEIIQKELPCDVIVLADTNEDIESHDAEILLKITEIRKDEEGLSNKSRIVSEFLDAQNAELGTIMGVNVMIISTELLSGYMVQTVKEPKRAKIFEELMTPEGSEICMRPIEYFIEKSLKEPCFMDVLWASRKKGNIAIGYMKNNTQILNPKVKSKLLPPDARIICIGPLGCKNAH
jgi:Castor and Pollux protein voltage-gated ion channel component